MMYPSSLLLCLNSTSIKLTGNEDGHKISDQSELWPDPINHFEVTCPWVVESKCSFSIRSSSNLLATRTGIKSQVFKFQLDRTAGFAVKCHWVPKHFFIGRFSYAETIGRFSYAETGFDFSSSSINSSTKDLLILFVLRLNVPVNNFSVMSGRSHRFLGN